MKAAEGSGNIAAPAAGPYVAPRTPAEELLAAIMSGLLEIDRVGMKDNFLALGGDSLLATLLAVRIQDAFGVDLPPSAIFDAADAAALCAAIQMSKQRMAETVPPPAPQDRAAGLPLSTEQEVLLFLHQMAEDKSQYNISRVFRVRGSLDSATLRQSFTELLRRHEILRTRLGAAEGRAVQIVDAPRPFDLESADMGGLPADQREEAARRQARDFVRRAFVLDADPLIRACLIRVADADHMLAISMHHLISDASSLNVMLSELGALYVAFAEGQAHALPPARLHYADYALWQRTAYPLSEESHVAYWKRVLDGVAPTRMPGPPLDFATRNFELGLLQFDLPPALSQRVRELARREDSTPAMALFAAFQLLLARLCQTDDVVGGMIFSRRTRPELQDVLGPMLIAHPVRTRNAPDAGFRSLLRQVKTAILDTYGHLEIDTMNLSERVTPPLWPLTAFNFISGRAGPAAIFEDGLRGTDPGVRIEEVEFKEESGGKAPADLSMELYDYPDRFGGKIVYAKELFEPEAIRRFADDFRTLLAEATADPERRIADIQLRA